MELEKERKLHSYLSNIFYYTFVLIIAVIFTLSFLVTDVELINNILYIVLIVFSIVIVFYLAVQMLQYNRRVNKKAQLGIFLIVIGFLLILTSTSKEISLGGWFLLDFLGDYFFVYWGIGSIVTGIIVELTFLDQFLWDMFVKPFIFLWEKLVVLVKLIWKQWKNIVLYTLDIASLGGIIYVAVTWGILWWKLVILSVCCVYPIIHHSKRIWRAIRYFVVEIIYRMFYEIGVFIKDVAVSIWNAIVTFFKFITEHWWIILKEFLRLALAVAGIVLLILKKQIDPATVVPIFAWWLIMFGAILIGEVFSRKIVLIKTWDAIKSFFTFIWDTIVDIFKFFLKHWWIILKEFLRLTTALTGILLFIYREEIDFTSIVSPFAWWLIMFGAILIGEVFSRKIVLIKTWDAVVSFFKFLWRVIKTLATKIWEAIRRMFSYFLRILKNIWELIKKHFKRVINETVRLIISASAIYLIYYGISTDANWYPWLVGISIILLVEVILRKAVLLKIYNFMKEVAQFFWEILKFLWEPFRFILTKLYELLKFIRKHWLKILLYTFDLVAIVAIIYFSVSWILDLWSLIIIVAGGIYLIAHHQKTIWKVIRFIAVDIFYKFFYNIAKFIKNMFVTIWEKIVAFVNFWKEHWKTIFKEIIRFAIAVASIVVFIIKERIDPTSYLPNYAWWIILIAGTIIGEVFSRKIVFIKTYEAIKSILLKFWGFLKAIPKFIGNVFYTIGVTIRTVSVYVYDNFIRLFLLLFMLFAIVYGIALIFSFIDPSVDFIGFFRDLETSARLSIGAGFIILFSVALILLRRELKKLRTGTSRVLYSKIKERWQK
jgi:hypothetical protein